MTTSNLMYAKQSVPFQLPNGEITRYQCRATDATVLDGNDLFREISNSKYANCISGDGESCRRALIRFALQHRDVCFDIFRHLDTNKCDQDFDAHLLDMAKSGTWGTDFEICLASIAYGIRIHRLRQIGKDKCDVMKSEDEISKVLPDWTSQPCVENSEAHLILYHHQYGKPNDSSCPFPNFYCTLQVPKQEEEDGDNICENTLSIHNSDNFQQQARTLTLDELREMTRKFRLARDWGQFHTPRNLLLALTAEVGELCEIFQWRGEVEIGLQSFSESDREHVGQELADVLMYITQLADRCDIDLPYATIKKMDANAKKYPADLVRGKSKKYNEY